MKAAGTALQGQDTGTRRWLYMALELSARKWLVVLGDGSRSPSRHSVKAGEREAVLAAIAKAKARCGLEVGAPVRSCYEAGRDGFWLHRWLVEQGIDNVVVDAASMTVSRRARRVKTDRIDGEKLYGDLLRYHAGEARVWAVLRVPTVGQEDGRRLGRELERLGKEANGHRNRVQSLLVLHNVRVQRVGGRGWAQQWQRIGGQLPADLGREIEREVARLELVRAQIKTVEALREQALAEGQAPIAVQLMRLRGLGIAGGWTVDRELLGWRQFANRREVAASVGLTPSPYRSGESAVEQGIAKSGNPRVRRLLVELAWCWLRHQSQSALSQWYRRRYGGGGQRGRRIGIVALARRLVIALWRYVEHGEIPAGAQLKPAVAPR